MSWAAITAIGTVLAGLALPLAFIQLAALRQDRLRGQVSRVAAWTGTPKQDGSVWSIPILIRNGSELPVQIDSLEATVRPRGYKRVLAAPEGTSEADYYMEKAFGRELPAYVAPGTIGPGDTWGQHVDHPSGGSWDEPAPPMASISRIVITDAVGYQWEVRSGRAGPARRIRRWRRWWWKRHGRL